MKNSLLLFRSLIIIVLIAGTPHAFAIYSQSSPGSLTTEKSTDTLVPQPLNDEDTIQSVWIGKYEVTYEGLKEKAIYQIKEEGGALKCYSTVLIDASGNRYDDNSLVMESLKTNEYIAEATYQIEYEGQSFSVDSKLQMDEVGNIWLNYTYQGYEGSETWKRLK